MYNTQSINERLKNFAKEHDIQNVERARVILCLERVIARLVQDKFLHSKLIFGGGFVIYKTVNSLRFTVDIDAIISGMDKEILIEKVTSALKIDLEDGFWFGDARVKKLEISSGYGGLRFKIPYKAGLPHPEEKELKRLRSVQLDISVGPNLEDVAKMERMTSTLSIFSGVEWSIYPLEFICAEKIHTLFSKGDLNTRGKDVYDLALVLPKTSATDLKQALVKTFEARGDEFAGLLELLKGVDTSYLLKNYLKVIGGSNEEDFQQSWQTIIRKIKILRF